MKNRLYLLFLLTAFILVSVVIVSAQEEACDIETEDVLEVVETVCTGIGQDQVCYGNTDVTIVTQEDDDDLDFEKPGDLAALSQVRSLFLSAFDPLEEVWGIAQMRLFATTTSGTQDVTLLLFGDVEVENTVEQTIVIEVTVGRYSANIRNFPSTNSLVLASIPSQTTIEAVGRLEDTSWIRVRVPESGAVGWVATELVSPTNEDESFDMLEVQDTDNPYFGPMQAFYYTSGNSCSDVAADGLLIQTPEGVARVTLLINEVSIEFIAGSNGATAFVQANQEDGMSVNMIDGTAYVESAGTSFFVDSTQSTTIPLGEGSIPTGAPSVPTAFDIEAMASIPLLGAVRDPSQPITSSIPITTNTETTTTNSTTNTGGGDTGGGGGGGKGCARANPNSQACK